MSVQTSNRPKADQNIFSVLIEDHNRHRALLKKICKSAEGSKERKQLFEELTFEIKGHSAAEEQALWSTVLRKPAITEDGRHAVAEHFEIDKLLNDLASTDPASSEWIGKMEKIREEYIHHIDEEEEEIFVSVEKELTDDDKKHMASVFARRKVAEKDKAEIVPRKKD